MHEATSYPHLPQRARAVADMLIARGYAKNVNNNVRITPAGEKALGKHD